MTHDSSPSNVTRVHLDRTARGHRHHRDSRRDAVAGIVPRQVQGQGHQLHVQLPAGGIVANLYVSDDPAGRLPTFAFMYSGRNAWDVAPEMLPALVPYGLTVPMWFCPGRPEERQEADQRFQQLFGRPISNPTDLNRYFQLRYVGTFAVLYHAWWVPRAINGDQRFLFPSATLAGTQARLTNGWPRKLEDPAAAIQPIISDYCTAGSQTNLALARAGHSQGNKLSSVNATYADGHTETHSRGTIQWQYTGADSAFY